MFLIQWCCVLSTARLLPMCYCSSVADNTVELFTSILRWLLGSVETGRENISNIGQKQVLTLWSDIQQFRVSVTEDRQMPQLFAN